MTQKLNGGQTIMKSKGFTLIELAVVLAIIAILAAILTPLVTSYVDEARNTRALADARMLADAVNLHVRDTGKYPIYSSYTSISTDSDTLFGPGTAPTFGSTNTSWGQMSSTSLQTRLNTNVFTLPTTYTAGRVVYRGPYTSGLEADPWGNSYIAMVGPATYGSALFVISAGANGVIETTKIQAGGSFAASGDDITSRIR
jgi:prepilin-type N-terminal cleavage/methylation domain-containing protein